MLPFRQSDKAVHTLVCVSVALALGCADSVDPSVHGASSVVVGPASQIQVAPSSASLVAGERSVLRCAAFDAQGVMLSSAPTWTSSDPTVMVLSSDGSVTAMRSGSATATCQIGSQTATSLITVSTAQVAFVEVSPGAGTIPPGTTLQLSGVPRDSLGFPVPGLNVQWASADTTIATVTSAGVVTARGTGDANIVATSGGVAGMTKVKVTGVAPPPVASIQVAVDQTSLNVGRFTHATATAFDAQGNVLSGRAITWSVSDPRVLSVVTLNATRATIGGLGQGNASVTATCEGHSTSVNISVGPATVAVVVASLASASITTGQTTLASAIPEDGFGNPVPGQTVTWTSLDPTIATVSSSGVVTGVAPGSVIIRATAGGVTGDASLTVTAVPVASVTTTLASSTLTVGQTTQAIAVPHDANGNMLTGRYIAWSSLNMAVATVSISGLVTAIAPGNAVIRATVESKTGDANLVVSSSSVSVPTTASVVVTFDSSTLATGHSSQAHATARDAQGNVLSGKTPTWISKTTLVASVSGTGVVTGAGSGTAVIQATIDGVGGSGSLAVTSGTITPTSPTTASVVVTFDSTSIGVGHTSQAKAVAKDASGNPIAGKTATWISNSAAIASVGSSTGIVTGLSAGSATIQATIDGVNGTGSLLVTPTSVITSPAPSGALASANFDDGTFGAFSNPWGTGIDVIADPTSRATGKVARIHYVNGPPGDPDSNLGLFPTNGPTISPTQDIWFQGDFYIDSQSDVMRKLFYFSGSPNTEQVIASLQPGSGVAGQQILYIAYVGPQDNATYLGGGLVTLQAWHTIKVHVKVNSAPGVPDGAVELWLDGVQRYSNLAVPWGDGSYPAFVFNSFGFGYQAQAMTPVNEYRYWDNVVFSRSPLP